MLQLILEANYIVLSDANYLNNNYCDLLRYQSIINVKYNSICDKLLTRVKVSCLSVSLFHCNDILEYHINAIIISVYVY